MKKIAYIFLIFFSLIGLQNCEDTYAPSLDYVTFEVDQPLVTVLKNGSTTIDVHVYSTKVMSSDRTFNIVVSGDTTLDPASYSVPSTVTIPANSNDGMIEVTFSDNNLGEDIELLALDLDLAGDSAFNGSSFNVEIQKKCPLSGINDLVGSYSVTTDPNGYENSFTTTADGSSSLVVDGLAQDFIVGFWGETVVSGGTFTMNVDLETGALTIPRQYIYTTNYGGDLYDYEIAGSGTWGNCGSKPTLTIKYDIYYPGDADGLAKTYKSYLSVGYLGGTFTID
ncbi:hypothetical protein GCM10007962_20690 [Yeosuana aromativorans]|uniref:Calx-beta domain-containing protein n=1 Tax=Yeosuana aromativorans TaxID=288019 RepID=A0A8J3FK22_9FLAO|nr:hypothetical protein [Yeosuana aromativorans]GGK26255.1 hypothetical protein GCM10007962_20690 [Yeosuana aromativorans]